MYQYHQSKYWYTGTLIYSDLPYYLCSRDEVHPKCYLSDVGLTYQTVFKTLEKNASGHAGQLYCGFGD